jgi:hypothetical protein
MLDIFVDFDIREVKKGDKPVEYVLARKLIEAGKKLDANAIHDPLVLAACVINVLSSESSSLRLSLSQVRISDLILNASSLVPAKPRRKSSA